MKKILSYCIACFYLFNLLSCKKYLDASPGSKLAIPEKLEDLQGLLDNNQNINVSYPYILDVLTDNIYLTTEIWKSLPQGERAAYIWQKTGLLQDMYSAPYTVVYTSNLALEELERFPADDAQQMLHDRIKGSALFLRAASFFGLSQVYAFPYYPSSATTDPGIPIRLETDFSVPVTRATVHDTYEQIVGDLKEAAGLLPAVSSVKTRPSKAAAFGWLARTYLQMHEYDSAGRYADLCLGLHDSLINFNTDIDVNSSAPFRRFNKEIIFYMASQNCSSLYPGRAKIDSLLYATYTEDDSRKEAFFYENGGEGRGTYTFKGDYDGTGAGSYSFAGIVTDEQYLIRAEAAARAGNAAAALADLNMLLSTRFEQGFFIPVTADNADDALVKILEERRKELLFRGTRWSDLRRLNTDPRFAVTITRNIENETKTLEPLSNGYLMWFPADVIRLSGIEQNP